MKLNMNKSYQMIKIEMMINPLLKKKCFVLILSLLGIFHPGICQNEAAIQPYKENPRYWQYKGQPVLLIGGTKDDNLFQIPDLKEHLDLLKSVGGNYIRNTMSSRDEGNVLPFKKVGDKYDLTQWNDEYWQRFENMLLWTEERDIIAQVEIWAIWDMWTSRWAQSPWNPANNVNYTFENTTLKENYGSEEIRPYKTDELHDFYFSVPELANDKTLLKYQQNFVDKILSYSFNYGNVLYCMTNEIFDQFSPEWGWYWARYIKDAANQSGKLVNVAEMYQYPVIRHEQHKASLDHPEVFDFEDISQNSGRYGVDENHWDNLRYVFNYIAEHPRPINHVKTYGKVEDAREKFLRSIIGGAASMRFHRPPSGIGLNEDAQTTIAMVRKIEELVKMWEVEAHMELLSERESDEAYLAALPGEKYLVYFTDGGSVRVDMPNAAGDYLLKWMNVSGGDWEYELPVTVDEDLKLSAPSRGGWIAVIVKKQNI